MTKGRKLLASLAVVGLLVEFARLRYFPAREWL